MSCRFAAANRQHSPKPSIRRNFKNFTIRLKTDRNSRLEESKHKGATASD
jgi:hypothetical protein